MPKKFWVATLIIATFFILILVLKFSGFLKFDLANLNQANSWLIFSIVTIGALIDSLNPCAISVLFITITFLLSLGYLKSKIILVGSAYILGIFLVYLAIGLGILKALNLFGMPSLFSKIFAIILILVGTINLINHFYKQFPLKLKIPNKSKPLLAKFIQKSSYPTSFILGILVGLFEFPCTGGPYLIVLSLLNSETTYVKGLFYLFYYNFIFVLPLILILIFASNIQLLKSIKYKNKSFQEKSRIAISMILIILGLIMILIS